MASILEVYEKIKRFNWAKAIEETFNEHSEELSALQVEQQYRGLNSNGTPIEPVYRPKTIELKSQAGKPIDRVTLRDTGAFHAGVKVYAENGRIIFTSSDVKTPLIEAKYQKGEQRIWGYSPEYTEKVKAILLATLKRKFNEAM